MIDLRPYMIFAGVLFVVACLVMAGPGVDPPPALADEPTITTTTTTGYAIAVAPLGADTSTPPEGAQFKLWRSTPWKKNSVDPGDRTEIWQAAGGTATMAQIKAAAPSLVPRVQEEIQAVRRQALSKAVANAGVAEVYSENYRAAEAYQAGEGNSTAMKSGLTARQHLQGFADAIGLPLDMYAGFIIQEYRNMGPLAYAVEKEYLRLSYQAAPNEQDLKTLLAYPVFYRQFCGL